MDDGTLVLGVFGAEPKSLLLWHIRRVRDCGLCIERLGVYRGVDTNSVTVLATHSKLHMDSMSECIRLNLPLNGL